jgi:hypothetical protein
MQELWGKEDFQKRLNPTAWVRALRCNTVYVTILTGKTPDSAVMTTRAEK